MNKNNFYRPEIDGLRAVSVISVLIYHLEISINHQIFPGGFLGVDIFFVISGYLITTIILMDLKTKTLAFQILLKDELEEFFLFYF